MYVYIIYPWQNSRSGNIKLRLDTLEIYLELLTLPQNKYVPDHSQYEKTYTDWVEYSQTVEIKMSSCL
jgi:hypothetical protein